MYNNKVSIIMPAYNNAEHISFTIESVRSQTYEDWEILIVDDCSTDDTYDIAFKYSQIDSRIKVFSLSENSGAAVARNTALKEATGRFIAYLDADDLWYENKLQVQVDFMKEKEIGFSCTSYEVIGNNGETKKKHIHMLPSVDYKQFLTNNLLQTVGMMVDTTIVDKTLLKMPNLRRRQDAATWLQVLKSGKKCYGIKEVLAKYRRTENSLSSNKIKAVKGVWYLYREVENLSFSFSCYCFIRYAFFAVWKRLYRK